MGHYLKSIQPNFYDIFLENNLAKRTAFFREPLIQFLWAKFREDFQVYFAAYMHEIYHSENGTKKIERLIQDINSLEFKTGFAILP